MSYKLYMYFCHLKYYNKVRAVINEMNYLSVLVLTLSILLIKGQITSRYNITSLSRKKRYLAFPERSRIVMSLVGLKELMTPARGYRCHLECDVFFDLPTRSFRQYVQSLSMHTRQRREIHDGVSKAIDLTGFNGDACIRRMICEVQELALFKHSSLFKKWLYLIFTNPNADGGEGCDRAIQECNVSFISMILDQMTGDSGEY